MVPDLKKVDRKEKARNKKTTCATWWACFAWLRRRPSNAVDLDQDCQSSTLLHENTTPLNPLVKAEELHGEVQYRAEIVDEQRLVSIRSQDTDRCDQEHHYHLEDSTNDLMHKPGDSNDPWQMANNFRRASADMEGISVRWLNALQNKTKAENDGMPVDRALSGIRRRAHPWLSAKQTVYWDNYSSLVPECTQLDTVHEGEELVTFGQRQPPQCINSDWSPPEITADVEPSNCANKDDSGDLSAMQITESFRQACVDLPEISAHWLDALTLQVMAEVDGGPADRSLFGVYQRLYPWMGAKEVALWDRYLTLVPSWSRLSEIPELLEEQLEDTPQLQEQHTTLQWLELSSQLACYLRQADTRTAPPDWMQTLALKVEAEHPRSNVDQAVIVSFQHACPQWVPPHKNTATKEQQQQQDEAAREVDLQLVASRQNSPKKLKFLELPLLLGSILGPASAHVPTTCSPRRTALSSGIDAWRKRSSAQVISHNLSTSFQGVFGRFEDYACRTGLRLVQTWRKKTPALDLDGLTNNLMGKHGRLESKILAPVIPDENLDQPLDCQQEQHDGAAPEEEAKMTLQIPTDQD